MLMIAGPLRCPGRPQFSFNELNFRWAPLFIMTQANLQTLQLRHVSRRWAWIRSWIRESTDNKDAPDFVAWIFPVLSGDSTFMHHERSDDTAVPLSEGYRFESPVVGWHCTFFQTLGGGRAPIRALVIEEERAHILCERNCHWLKIISNSLQLTSSGSVNLVENYLWGRLMTLKWSLKLIRSDGGGETEREKRTI